MYTHTKLLLIILCLNACSLYGQDTHKVDSLKRSLLLATGDARFEVLNELFKAYNTSNFDEALSYAERFDEEASAHADSVRMVQGGRMRAYALMYMGRNEDAAEILVRILGIANRNQKKYPDLKGQIKFILNNAGLAYTYLGNYDKALDYHYQSLLIRQEEGDKKSIRTALNNIGLVFYNLKDYDRAIQNYLKAVDISKELGDFSGLERIYINLGLSYNQLGKFNEAIKFFNDGFELCSDKCDNNVMKEGLNGLGHAYKSNHQLEIAESNFLKSLAISKKQDDKRYTTENLFEIGRIELELKKEKEGLDYIKEAEAMAELINLAELKLSVYKELASYYGKKKDFEQSFNYQNKYAQFKDSIYSEQLMKNLTQVQTNFDQRENLKTIAKTNQLVALQREVISRERRQYVFIILITALIVILAGLLFYFTRRQQRANSQLSQAKRRIEEQNSQLAAYNKQLKEKVEERTNELNLSNDALRHVNEELDDFIYKTSHDIRGPLATLKGMTNVALMDVKDELATTYLKRLDSTADRMNTILTRLMIVNQINNSVLMPIKINFKEIINEIFESERKKNEYPANFETTLDMDASAWIISDLSLVKIILENLIDNAIKFHNNSKGFTPFAKVKISKVKNEVKVTVEDNGIGMSDRESKDVFRMFMRASERSEIGGIGLYLAKISCEKIGGSIRLAHSDFTGSIFEVIFPIELTEEVKSKNKRVQLLAASRKKIVDASPNSSSAVD